MKDDWDGSHADGVKVARQGCYSTGIDHLSHSNPDLARKVIAAADAIVRQCLSCGCLAECDPARPCAACGASHFHLIPPARELADW